MKSKLTITVDEALIPEAKRCAHRDDKSLSELVEELLRNAVRKKTGSFANRWQGKFSLTQAKDARASYLKRRYQ